MWVKARNNERLQLFRQSCADRAAATELNEDIAQMRVQLAGIAGEEDKNRAVLGFAFALLVSAAGVRTLSSLMQIDLVGGTGGLSDDYQKHLAHAVDVILTAGLITGGSDSLAKLLQIIKDSMTQPLKPP